MHKKHTFVLLAVAAAVGWYFTNRAPQADSTVVVPTANTATKEPISPTPAPQEPPAAARAEPDYYLELHKALHAPDAVAKVMAILKKAEGLAPEARLKLLNRLGPILSNASAEISHGVVMELHKLNFDEAQRLGNALVKHLVKVDTNKATAWVAGLDPTINARQFYQAIGHDWAVTDKTAVLGWINTLQENMHNQAAAVEGLADVWSTQNLNDFLAWGQKIEDPHVRGNALIKAIKLVAVNDPALAAQLSLTFSDTLPQRQGLVSALNAWVPRDANAAEAFVEKITDAAMRREGQLALVAALGAHNPPAAKSYIPKLPAELQPQAQQVLEAAKPFGTQP